MYRVSVRKTIYETYLVPADNAEDARENYLEGDMVYDKEAEAEVIEVEEEGG